MGILPLKIKCWLLKKSLGGNFYSVFAICDCKESVFDKYVLFIIYECFIEIDMSRKEGGKKSDILFQIVVQFFNLQAAVFGADSNYFGLYTFILEVELVEAIC